MKHMLASWHSVTEKEYPQYVHLIPYPYDIELSKIDNGGVMTDTCNTEEKANLLIDDPVNGVFHSMFCHNYLRNVWVKNVLESLTEFLRTDINDSLDEVASELNVSSRFMPLACTFDKSFSLYANYPMGLGEVFCQSIMDNHSCERLLHVYRAEYGGRQDVTSMAAISIFWNKNYCVDFFDDMISYCGKNEKILPRNLMILISSVEIIAMSRLWSILHITTVMPMRWLKEYTHNMKEYEWG